MQAAADHVTYQLLNEHSRAGYLLTAIQCSDAGLQAAVASIKTDQTPNGLQNDFESAASHILPYNPVQNKRTERPGGKCNSAEISNTTGKEVEVSAFGSKKGIGKSGVHLRDTILTTTRSYLGIRKMSFKNGGPRRDKKRERATSMNLKRNVWPESKPLETSGLVQYEPLEFFLCFMFLSRVDGYDINHRTGGNTQAG